MWTQNDTYPKYYSGKQVCPDCKTEFQWEYVDDGHRQRGPGVPGAVITIEKKPGIANCWTAKTRSSEHRVLLCHCPHCDFTVEIEGTENIPL